MATRSREIKSIALIGAGTIGRSWATLFAGKGYRVTLEDVDAQALKVAERMVTSNLSDLVHYGLVSKLRARTALGRMNYTTSLREAVEDAQYVQESVLETMSLKKRVFSEICSMVEDSSVVASSTGGFPMTQIQKGVHRPQRCIVVHPSTHPLYLTTLVELVPGKQTSAGTIRATYALMKRIGKQPIVLRSEVQDYITNRLQFAFWREAMDMVGRGLVSASDVDTAFTEVVRAAYCFGHGPFMQLHMHGGSHGLGGVEAALEHYNQVLPETWASMAKWKTIPKRVRVGVARSVHDYVNQKGMSMKNLAKERDRNLLPLAREVWKQR
jgi:3-hydroxyacyl-CoA dehydrogenase